MDAIPQELKALRQWHCWKDSNGTKLPVQINGQMAKSNAPSTWSSFDAAIAASEIFSGLSFEITEPYTGIDLDDCIDAFGELRPWASEILKHFRSLAYAEISPSGKGIKLITRARKPDGSRCVHSFNDGKQQVECYDHARFWTITGDLWGQFSTIADGQAAVDWLCSEYLKPSKPAPKSSSPNPSRLASFFQSDLEQRCTAYAESVQLPAVGGRNAACFQLAGHLKSIVDDFGKSLPESQIIEIVEHWAASQGATPREGEIEKACNSAFRNGTPRETKESQPLLVSTEPDPDVDLSGIMRQCSIPEEIQAATNFPDECLEATGLIGELVRYNLDTALYPLPELALAGALSLMASVTGGKVEGLRARTNVYVMGLAPSGGGKDYARKLNRKILLHAGGGHICGPERIGSHAGIISALAENWNTLFQIDEIGRLLATMQSAQMSPHLYNIASVLMQIYSSADDIWQADAYGDRKKCKTLEYPHCVVYGTSIPDGFWESLTKKNLSDGLIGRFLVFENSDYVDFQDVDEQPLPGSVTERSRHWLEHKTHSGNLAGLSNHDSAHPQRVDATEEAAERLKKHAVDISIRRKHEEPVEAAIWSRHAEKTNKLALLFACSRWGPDLPWPTINLGDADKAVKLNNYLTRRMLRRAGLYVSESPFETEQLKVLRVLKRRPEWTQSEITRATRWLRVRDRNEILATLEQSGMIRLEEQENVGAGRKATIIKVA